MDPESGFSILNDKEREVVLSYSDVEILFVPNKTFYRNAENVFYRRHAVAIISKLSRRIENDTFIPYLAMNYFDRFFSKNSSILEDVEGSSDTVKVRLIAIACLTLAAKMRIKDFSIDHFLITFYKIVNVRISYHMVMRTELLILRELYWEMISVTPFTFLNFYYRYFKKYGGFKRRCINEIIVQAQGEHTFVHYYPTVIAISALLAASKIAYPTLYREIVIPFTVTKVLPKLLQDKVTVCVDEMVNLCNRLDIRIETPELGIPSTSELKESQENKESGIPSTSELKESQQNKESGIPSTSELKEIQQKKGKGVMVVDSYEEEDDDEEEGTSLMRRYLDRSKMTKTSQALKISERVEEENKKLDKGETSGDGYKARVEVIIRQPLEKGKAVVGEKMERYISELAELEELKRLMNFELKWPDEVPSIEPQSQTVPSIEPQSHTVLSIEPQSQTVNRSKSIKGRIVKAGKKLTCGDCKVG